MDRERAEKLIRTGSAAGFVSAALTFVLAIVAMSAPETLAATGYDGSMILDAVLVAFLAWRIRRGSRVAAVTLLVYFIVAKISLALVSGRMAGMGIVAVVFLVFFFNAARGTFALHRIRLRDDDGYRPRPWLTALGSVGAAMVVLIMGFGLAVEGLGPSTALVDGDDLGKDVKAFLVEQGMIQPQDTVVLFYSAALLDFRKDGNLLTDQAVVAYEETEGHLSFYALRYDEIDDVQIDDAGDALSDAVLSVFNAVGDGFSLYVPTEDSGLKRFLDELERRRTRAQASKHRISALCGPPCRAGAVRWPHRTGTVL